MPIDRILQVSDYLSSYMDSNPEVNWSNILENAIRDWQKEQEYGTLGLVMKYFVLKPAGDTAHARASRAAMRAYAFAIRGHNPMLSRAVRDWAELEMSIANAEDQPNDDQDSTVKRQGGDHPGSAGPDA